MCFVYQPIFDEMTDREITAQLKNSIKAAVRIAPMISDRMEAPATVRRMADISPAPNFCAVSTVNPAVMPTTKP